MSTNIYLGIDNGLNGAIVILQGNKILEKLVMPVIKSTKSKTEYDIFAIKKIFIKYKNAIVVLEKAHAMPKLGGVQAFNFGKNYGIMMGLLSALNMSYYVIHPKTWQKAMFRDINSKDTKQASALIAQRLFPEEDFTATERSVKIHDGLTDALLLAKYGQQHL